MKSQVEKVASLAMKLGAKHLADYGHVKSRHDFTQRQLMSCLVLRAYLKTTYRGLVDLLEGHGRLREVLGMEVKLPHYTTLQKFGARQDVQAVADAMIAQIGAAALQAAGAQAAVAMDATGMETSNASAHFTSRAGHPRRKWQKLSITIVCGALLPLGLVMDWGPSNDKRQALELLQKTFAVVKTSGTSPEKLYADAGYDANWVHGLCRDEWSVASFIKPVNYRADGTLGGKWRGGMTPQGLADAGYGKRWHVEAFFSGLKRMMGSTLSARSETTLAKEAILRLLAYTLHR